MHLLISYIAVLLPRAEMVQHIQLPQDGYSKHQPSVVRALLVNELRLILTYLSPPTSANAFAQSLGITYHDLILTPTFNALHCAKNRSLEAFADAGL